MTQINCDADIAHRLSGARNPYDILADIFDTYPPDITLYVNDTAHKQRIGADGAFSEVNSGVLFDFAGEWMQNSRPTLEAVVDAGVRTVLYVGDAVSAVCCSASVCLMCPLVWIRTICSITSASRRWCVIVLFALRGRLKEYSSSWTRCKRNSAPSGPSWTSPTSQCTESLQDCSRTLAPSPTCESSERMCLLTSHFKPNVSTDERDGLPSGHEVPAYKFGNLSTGEAALQMFAQIVGNNPLSAT